MYIYPYNPHSQGAANLAEELSAPRIKRQNSRFKGNRNKIVVNWGNSGELPEEILKCQVLNVSNRVRVMSNKLNFFQAMAETDVKTPQWTTSKDEALGWFNNQRCTVFARTALNGHSGEGIVELNKPEDFNQIREGTLLVKYVPKKDEYRIHLTSLDGVIDVQRKARRLAAPDPNWRIRNHDNGFVYARGAVRDTPEVVLEQARRTFNASGLDFGGVDVIYNKKHNAAYVLELNSAPGLEGTTIMKYANALRRLGQSRAGEPMEERMNVPEPNVRAELPPAGMYVEQVRMRHPPRPWEVEVAENDRELGYEEDPD